MVVAEPESWLLVVNPEAEEPVAFWHEYDIATDSPTSATCGEHEISGVGAPVGNVDVAVPGPHW